MREKTRDPGRPQGSAALSRGLGGSCRYLPEYAVIKRLAKVLSNSPDVLYFYVRRVPDYVKILAKVALRQPIGRLERHWSWLREQPTRTRTTELQPQPRGIELHRLHAGESTSGPRLRFSCRDAHPICASPARLTLTSPTLGRLASTTARAHTCK